MITHSQIVSRNLDVARRFYAATGRPLGLSIIEEEDGAFFLGRAGTGTVICVRSAECEGGHDNQPESRPAYVALDAPDDMTVRAFYRAALEAGGREHILGYPAPQPTDGQFTYYATKVADPDGNCIECGWRRQAPTRPNIP